MFASIPSSSNVPDSDPSSLPTPFESGIIPHPGTFSDLDILVAKRKGTRSCFTHLPVQNFVSYRSLSLIFHVFVSNLASEYIPKHVSEALSHSKWKLGNDRRNECLREKPCLGAYSSS